MKSTRQPQDSKPTPSANLSQAVSKLLTLGNSEYVSFQFWDISGTNLNNRNLVNAVLVADVVVFVYDITHVGSFKRLQSWLRAVKMCFGVLDNHPKSDIRLPHLVLVANKGNQELTLVDLNNMRTVSLESHSDFYIRGKFQAQISLSCFKPEVTRAWATSTACAVANLGMEANLVFYF